MKTFLISLTISFLIPLGLLGQSSLIDQYVAEALANNPDFERAGLSVKQQEARLDQAKGLFLPQVSMRATYTLAAGGRTIDFPIGDLLNPVYATLNQLSDVPAFPTNLANESIQFLPNDFQETHLRLIQPVFSPDIIANKRAQEALLEASHTSLEVSAVTLNRDVRQAYLGYLQAAEQVKIYEETEALLQEQLRVSERLVSADKATPEAVSQAEYALSQWSGELARAREQEASARAYANLLIGRELREPLETDSSLRPGAWAPNLEELLAEISSNRAELQFLGQQTEAQGWDVQRQMGQWLPTLTVVSDLGFQGFGYRFGDNQGFALAQASLNWNLYQGGQRKAALQEAELASQGLRLQSVQLARQLALQVEQAWYGWRAARDAYAAALDGEVHAARLYRQTNQRFALGQLNALQLEQARLTWTQARLGLNAARFHWLLAETNLRFAAGIL